MTTKAALLLSLLLPAGKLWSQTGSVVLPSGTPLAATIPDHLPMRIGTPINAQLLYPVYADNKLVLPERSHLLGSVVGLRPDSSRRVEARLRGDFTPFRIPVVRFDRVVLPGGASLAIQTGTATDGAPVFRLVPPPPRKGGFLRQRLDDGVQMARDRVAIVTGPDKRDRLVQFLYTQIPYHPQRIEKGTSWTVRTSAPLSLPQPASSSSRAIPVASPTQPDAARTWIVQASLDENLSSMTTRSGQLIHATVAEPIYNPDGTIAVPEGARLEGAVTQVHPAKLFGRNGVLRFDFRQIAFPSGQTQNVQASLAGIDAPGGNLAIDSEGKVKPKPQDKLAVPLILFALASRPLDRDGGDNQFGKSAVASNSFGLVGFIIGTTSRAPNVAAGIGYYGTALSLYNRWIKRGSEITFARDTRIVVQTTARRSARLAPDNASPAAR